MDLVPDAHLDTRHMRHVVALADTLHFGHAAARMNMSQPPFSRQIAAIEQSLGVRLFERSSRAVSLTTAGRISPRIAAAFSPVSTPPAAMSGWWPMA